MESCSFTALLIPVLTDKGAGAQRLTCCRPPCLLAYGSVPLPTPQCMPSHPLYTQQSIHFTHMYSCMRLYADAELFLELLLSRTEIMLGAVLGFLTPFPPLKAMQYPGSLARHGPMPRPEMGSDLV